MKNFEIFNRENLIRYARGACIGLFSGRSWQGLLQGMVATHVCNGDILTNQDAKTPLRVAELIKNNWPTLVFFGVNSGFSLAGYGKYFATIIGIVPLVFFVPFSGPKKAVALSAIAIPSLFADKGENGWSLSMSFATLGAIKSVPYIKNEWKKTIEEKLGEGSSRWVTSLAKCASVYLAANELLKGNLAPFFFHLYTDGFSTDKTSADGLKARVLSIGHNRLFQVAATAGAGSCVLEKSFDIPFPLMKAVSNPYAIFGIGCSVFSLYVWKNLSAIKKELEDAVDVEENDVICEVSEKDMEQLAKMGIISAVAAIILHPLIGLSAFGFQAYLYFSDAKAPSIEKTAHQLMKACFQKVYRVTIG